VVEHHGPDLSAADPDFQQPSSGSPRTYVALRTHGFLYVEYDDGEREVYDGAACWAAMHLSAGALGALRR
jgi:N-acetylglucosamine-6-sulfatase